MNTFQPPYITKDELIGSLDAIGLYTPRVERALEYAERAHKEQKRDFGFPYLEEHIYPITASILQRYANDPELEEIVITGLLHDVLEDDPNASAEEMKKDFGELTLANVQLVTKKPEENLSTIPNEQKIEINVKMLKALEHAPRVAQIIKLEDRLNNLASFEKQSGPKYVRYVQETKNYFIPFAEAHLPMYAPLFQEQVNRLAQ